MADKMGRKYIIAGLAALIATCVWVLFASSITYKPYLLIAAFLSGMGINTIYWLGYTVVQDAVPAHYAGFATGITGGTGYFVASFAGWALGAVTEAFGYLTAVYGLLMGFEVLVFFCALFLLPSKPKLEDV